MATHVMWGFIENNFFRFLINHSRYVGFNLKNFNFIWNIQGSYASNDIQNEV